MFKKTLSTLALIAAVAFLLVALITLSQLITQPQTAANHINYLISPKSNNPQITR